MIFASKQARSGWTNWHLLGAVLMAVVGGIATMDAWTNILSISIHRHHTRHLILLPLVVVWLVWVRRERFQLCEPAGTWAGPLIVLVGWMICVLGYRTEVEVMWHFGALAVVIGCVISVLGLRVLGAFSAAFAALVIVIPIPGSILNYTTHTISEVASTLILPTLGTAVTALQMQTAASCLLCAVLLAYAFAFGTPYRGWIRSLLIAVSPLMALVVLMLQMGLYRLFMAIWHTDQAAATWTNRAGWLTLPLMLLVLWSLIRLLRWAAVPLRYYRVA